MFLRSLKYVFLIVVLTAPIKGRIRYMLTPSAIIDFMVVVPFYLPFFFDLDLRFLRVLRLFRLFTLFKMARYSKSLHLFKMVLRDTRQELLIVLAVTMGMLVFASGVIYFIENKAQREGGSGRLMAEWSGKSEIFSQDIQPAYLQISLCRI